MKMLWLSILTCLMLLLGCGAASTPGGPQPVSSPPTSPNPALISFSDAVPAGSSGFMATANGTGFTPNSTLVWNGSALVTSFQTTGILYANIPATLLAVPGTASVLIRDTVSGETSNSLTFAILSPAAVGASVVALVSSSPSGVPADGDSLIGPGISATGRFVVFQSAGTNLVAEQVIAPWQNIYLTDTCLGVATFCQPSTQLISVSADGKFGGNWQSRYASVSQDGRYVAFDSGATNLLTSMPTYCSSTSNCIYLRDTCIGATSSCVPKTILGSVVPGEVGANGANPILSSSGRYQTFASNAQGTSLPQVYLRDWCGSNVSGCTQNTSLISVNGLGAPSNEGSQPQSLSDSGRFVGFVSYSTNLLEPGQTLTQSVSRMFEKDTCIGSTGPCTIQTTEVDVPNGGGTSNAGLDYQAVPSLSSDGRYVAFSSNATNLVATDVGGFGNVYVRDMCVNVLSCTPHNSLVSLGNDGSVANSGSHQQSMSSDGRYVAFTSIATNLVWGLPYAAGTWQDVYVRDTCTGAPASCHPSTVRVAVRNSPSYQSGSNAGASLPEISADGHYVAFISSSSNLTSVGTAGHSQVFISRTGF